LQSASDEHRASVLAQELQASDSFRPQRLYVFGTGLVTSQYWPCGHELFALPCPAALPHGCPVRTPPVVAALPPPVCPARLRSGAVRFDATRRLVAVGLARSSSSRADRTISGTIGHKLAMKMKEVPKNILLYKIRLY
jgi:hypothetical protein